MTERDKLIAVLLALTALIFSGIEKFLLKRIDEALYCLGLSIACFVMTQLLMFDDHLRREENE